MEFVIIILVLIVASALFLGWLAVCFVAGSVRLIARIVGAPFRMAQQTDHRTHRRTVDARIVRTERSDDIQCANSACHARLPGEANFCARCGTAIQRARPQLPVVMPEPRRGGFTQVA